MSTKSGGRTPKSELPITREFYDAFQRQELDRLDTIISDDVLINSPAVFGLRGLRPLKHFAREFTDLGYRIDLVDEHLALDEQGTGRGFITWCLYWKHTKEFGGLTPTGRESTAVQTVLFSIAGDRITRLDLTDNTLDLAIYESERGRAVEQDVRPQPIVRGIDRREPAALRPDSA